MTSRHGRAVKAKLDRECKRRSAQLDSAPGLVLNSVAALETELRTCAVPEDLSAVEYFSLLHHLSSLQIDAATRRTDRVALIVGLTWSEEVIGAPNIPAVLKTRAGYSLANAILERYQIELMEFRTIPFTKASLRRAPFELAHRDELRRARLLLAEAGHADDLEGIERSRALCNLGNVLDESGRWVEAYEAYADALAADPRNGNAAGNAAELLRRRLSTGRGLRGHYAAVYNKYAVMAKALRTNTVAIAGESAARRWDALPILDGVGHTAHEGNQLDRYQSWIREHRLALSEAIEGLGSDNPRWDDAMANSVTVALGDPDPPPIFAALNVLKAEFLVARRLAYQGELHLTDHPSTQHPEDTGTYASTMDYSIYGQPSAELILAQRAAIDVLDKVAVAANLHFGTRMEPEQVNFRNYWFDQGSGAIRKKLPRLAPPNPPGAAVALAELSYDIHKDGLYSDALALRNAGTHRLVHVNPFEPGGVSAKAQNTIGLHELIDGCHQTLQVIRSAYLYLIDLISEGQPAADDPRYPKLPLPMQQ